MSWMNWVDGWVGGRWVDVWLYKWMNGCVSTWIMNGWMSWMNGWMNGRKEG